MVDHQDKGRGGGGGGGGKYALISGSACKQTK